MSVRPQPAPAIIFICARNAVRSPMAEALWRLRFGAQAQAFSGGIAPASLPDGHMITVMAEKGADLSGYECRGLGEAAAEPVDLVVCLAAEIAEKARAFASARAAAFAIWPVEDPTGFGERDRFLRLAAYRAARDAIEGRILAFETESGLA